MPVVLLVTLGVSLTSAVQATSIAPTLMPLFAGLFAWAFLRERQGRQRWLGYTGTFVGLSLLVSLGAAVHGPPNLAGLSALVPAADMWAIYTLLFRKSGLTPIECATPICFWPAVLFLPVYVFLGLSRFSHASAAEQAVYQGVLVSGVAIFTFNRAVALLGSSAATAIIALLPAMASLIAIPAFGERPAPIERVAIAIIIGGVLLAARRPNKPEATRPERRHT